MSRLDPYKQTIQQIVELKSQGYNFREIGEMLSLPRTTVRDRYNRWLAEQATLMQEDSEIAEDLLKQSALGKAVQEYKESQKDNSVVLVISDMHIPYCHSNTFNFLKNIKEKYQPTRVICIGDELDKHSLSYHDHDPDLPSAGDELKLALPMIKELKDLFPEMDILESNHGSLVYRKAKTNGIPKHYLKSYNEVLGVDDKWKWHFDLTITLPNGNKCYFHHGKVGEGIKLSQSMGMNCVQGHFHERFKVDYWANPLGLYWSMQVGSLVDDSSLAMAYNNANLKRPIIGVGLIIDSNPLLEPMVL